MGDNSVLAHKSLSKIITEHILSSTPSLVWMEKRRHRGRYFSTYGYRRWKSSKVTCFVSISREVDSASSRGFPADQCLLPSVLKCEVLNTRGFHCKRCHRAAFQLDKRVERIPASLSWLLYHPWDICPWTMVQRDCLSSCNDLCSLRVEEDMEET